MSTIDPHTSPADMRSGAPASTSPKPNEFSFSQRHAWLREYELATHAGRATAPGAVASHLGEASSADANGTAARASDASAAGMADAPRHAAPGLVARDAFQRPALQLPGAPGKSSLPALRPNAPTTGPSPGFVPTSLQLSSLALRPTPVASGPRPDAMAEPRAQRMVTVQQDDEHLRVTVRDSALDEQAAQRLLRRLNAAGVSQATRHVQVTVNGHSVEQHTPYREE